jgi:hypothetical protein
MCVFWYVSFYLFVAEGVPHLWHPICEMHYHVLFDFMPQED